jgi:hypothetical protein
MSHEEIDVITENKTIVVQIEKNGLRIGSPQAHHSTDIKLSAL